MIKFYFDSPGHTLLPTGWTKCDFIMLPLWLYPCCSDCFFFFWYLFVFQNNFQYHLDRTFHSEHISCRYSLSTTQLLLKTGRSWPSCDCHGRNIWLSCWWKLPCLCNVDCFQSARYSRNSSNHANLVSLTLFYGFKNSFDLILCSSVFLTFYSSTSICVTSRE